MLMIDARDVLVMDEYQGSIWIIHRIELNPMLTIQFD
jgi:hypothetical protein